MFITYLASKFGTRKALKGYSPQGIDAPHVPLLRGKVGAVIWGLIILLVFYITKGNPIIAPAMLVVVLRSLVTRHAEEREEVAEEPTYMYAPAPWAPPKVTVLAPEALPFTEAVLERVQLSVWQSSEGPVVSVITVPDGEILTKTFPSWPSAGRYVDKVKKGYEAKGVAVTFVEEQI